jgi:hypothetical protein
MRYFLKVNRGFLFFPLDLVGLFSRYEKLGDQGEEVRKEKEHEVPEKLQLDSSSKKSDDYHDRCDPDPGDDEVFAFHVGCHVVWSYEILF